MTNDKFLGTDFGGGTIQKYEGRSTRYEGVRSYFDVETTGKMTNDE